MKSVRKGVINHASKQLFAYISKNSKQKQKQLQKSTTQSKGTISLDNFRSKDAVETKWWIESLNLLDSDKQILFSGAWLNGSIISACQVILASQFTRKSGFQDVLHGIVMDYTIQTQGFIQVLHDADRNHWVTISNVGSSEPEVVHVYDSMFSYSSPCLHAQVACLLHTTKPSFKLAFVDLHKQDGYNDCGVFAVAFAATLCFDQQPGKFIFHQNQMRQHLLACLERSCFTMFPVKSERRHGMKIRNLEHVNVYCLCRMPDIPNQPKMISCSNCSEWFHASSCVTDIQDQTVLGRLKPNGLAQSVLLRFDYHNYTCIITQLYVAIAICNQLKNDNDYIHVL